MPLGIQLVLITRSPSFAHIHNRIVHCNHNIINFISYKIHVMDINDHLHNHGSAFNTEYVLPCEFLGDAKIT